VILFISDLHLTPQAPGVTRIFLDFLGGRARAAEQLFILGDLFDGFCPHGKEYYRCIQIGFMHLAAGLTHTSGHFLPE